MSPEKDTSEQHDPQKTQTGLHKGELRVIWRRDEPFYAMDAISDVLQRTPLPHSHSVYGEGILFKLDDLTHIQLFPDIGIARVRIADSPNEFQTRNYKIDRIAVQRLNAGEAFVSFTAFRERGGSVVNIFPNGEVNEFHFPMSTMAYNLRLELNRSAIPELGDRRVYSVPEAAAIIGCHPNNVRQLLRKGSLLGGQIGREWWVDADVVDRYRRTRRGFRPADQ